jgi:hypothetical protein
LKVVFKGRVFIVVPYDKEVKVDLHGYLLELGWRVQLILEGESTTYYKTYDSHKEYGTIYREVEELKILIGGDNDEEDS